MSNKVKRAELRRLGLPQPERVRRAKRASSTGRGVFDAIARRLSSNECPLCGARIQEQIDHGLGFRGKQKSMPVCLNGHRQDAWESQRPKAETA